MGRSAARCRDAATPGGVLRISAGFPAPISVTPLGGLGRLVGFSATAPRVRFPGLILSNDGGARRILRGGMTHQLLLDVALIIAMMGALHRFEARLARSAHARRTPRARAIPNPGGKQRED